MLRVALKAPTKNKGQRMNSLTVHDIGTEVNLNDGLAHIISIWIKDRNRVVYELGWWAKDDYRTGYFSDWQFVVGAGTKLKVGFSEAAEIRKGRK